MLKGILFSKWVLIGVLTLFFVWGVSTSQAQEQLFPDPSVVDLSFELLNDSSLVVVITIQNRGTQSTVNGQGEVFLTSPDGTVVNLNLPGAFSFSSLDPNESRRVISTVTITGQPDGPYTANATITALASNSVLALNDENLENNSFSADFTFFREPQLRPVQIDFNPPFFDIDFISQVNLSVLVNNFGSQPSFNNNLVNVDFAFCRLQIGEEFCNSDDFRTFDTKALDLNSTDTLESRAFLNQRSEIRIRQWPVNACMPLTSAGVTADCPDIGGTLDPGTYIIRATVDEINTIAEVDENDNVVFARFTIPGAGGGSGGVRITNMVVGINGEEARGMMWLVVDGSTLVGLDKRELERFGECGGINLGTTCPYENSPSRIASINQFTTISQNPDPLRVGFGTAIVDIFSSALDNYDNQFTDNQGNALQGRVALIEDDFRPATITKMVQNRSRQILYVGLSDGNLIRYNFANPANIIKNVLPLSSGEIVDLQIIDQGIYVAANAPNSNDPNAIGSILFVEEGTLTTLTRQSIVSGNLIQKIHISPSSQVFIATEQTINPTQPTLRMFWASSMVVNGNITGQLENLQEAQLGTVFTGASWDDFVINSRNRAFLSATDNTGQSRLFGYNFRRGFSGGIETLTPSLIFGPFVEFIDQCDQRVVTLGDVQMLALGDDTPDVSADQVLHIATDGTPRVLTLGVQTRNQFGIIQDVTNANELLNWWVQLEGRPTSIRIDDAGEDRGRNADGSVVFPNGRLFVTSENQSLNLINGVNRTCSTPNQIDDILTTDAGVLAPVDTSGGNFFDALTFLSVPQVTAFYAGNRIYMWLGLLQDIDATTVN